MKTVEEAIKTLKEICCTRCPYGSQDMDSCDIRGCDEREAIKILEQFDAFDKIKDYVDFIKHIGLGKRKSLEFIEKYIDGLKAGK